MSKVKTVKQKALIVGALVALILIIDQWIKVYIKTTFLYGEERPILGDWFVLEYVENPGMAFGTSFGQKSWHKLALSIFRIIAISALIYFWVKQAKKHVRTEYLIALGLIVAGATGNLIDSMFYDFVFPYDPCFPGNISEGSGIMADCNFWGQIETKPRGFLLGNVVDMFKFDATWPQGMPLVGGSQVFPAIWNFADAAISIGVVMIFVRQKAYFPKHKEESQEVVAETKQQDTTID